MQKLEDEGKIEVRERTLENGITYPSDEELIMLILGSGTRKKPIEILALEVLETVMASNDEDLIDNLLHIDGIGRTKALMIAAALEFGRRFNRNPQYALSTPSEIIPFIQNYAMQAQEHFLCVTLNGAREIISIRVICTGSGNMAIIKPSDVFANAIKEHASAIIVSHNHPSGNPAPSMQDIKTTLKLYQAAEILGISLLDHIIITKRNYFSFLEHGIIDEKSLSKALHTYNS